MADQPSYDPLTASTFFDDNRSARHLVEGTIPRGWLADQALRVPDTATDFPIPVTGDLLARGQERFDIYCSVCHGLLGDGNGRIPARGFQRPPSFHTDELRNSPVGKIYDVITNGFGAMPRYGPQIASRDRWAIIAYLRALQYSQHASASELPPQVRQQLESVQ
jgi:mono/diheme cytochrome c family protein